MTYNHIAANIQSKTPLQILTNRLGEFEDLLVLAQAERNAAETRDFETLLAIMEQRETFSAGLALDGSFLAAICQQANEQDLELLRGNPAARRMCTLITQINEQDARTQTVLSEIKKELVQECATLAQTQRNLGSYKILRHSTTIACDQMV